MKLLKSIFCTAIITIMFVIIMVGLFILKLFIPFTIIAGIFSIIGVAVACGSLFMWLYQAPDVHAEARPRIKVFKENNLKNDENFTVDDIIAEEKGETEWGSFDFKK